jgi:hypothetical protein
LPSKPVVLAASFNHLVLKAPTLPVLPSLELREYGFKGGAARHALAAVLGLDVQLFPVRDIDLMSLSGTDGGQDAWMAAKYSPSDFSKRGAFAVERVDGFSHYIKGRDLTINEAYVLDGEIHASMSCIFDMLGMVLRASASVNDRCSFPSGKVAVRALRFLAEKQTAGSKWTLEGIPPASFREASAFTIALHLERAFKQSQQTAQKFLILCTKYGVGGNLVSSNLIETVKNLANAMIAEKEQPSLPVFDIFRRLL